MNNYGQEVARLFGAALPAFRSLDEARSALFAERDARLVLMNRAASNSGVFRADSTPESLKKMEAWYFLLAELDGFRALGMIREEFEGLMATYFCHVAVASRSTAEWHVEEFAFATGKYEIGVKRAPLKFMRRSFANHFERKANRTRTSIYREFNRYFPE